MPLREDLYWSLNVNQLVIIPLRERVSFCLPLLVEDLVNNKPLTTELLGLDRKTHYIRLDELSRQRRIELLRISAEEQPGQDIAHGAAHNRCSSQRER
jgi:hypothetical protein